MNQQVLLDELKRDTSTSRNSRRDLRRMLQKGSAWPSLYITEVRCWNVAEACETWQPLAFLLPHEIVGAIAKHADLDELMSTNALDPLSKEHLEKCEAEAGCKLLGIGIWGDAIPCQWDRDESVECVSMNFPGLGEEWKEVRIPITALPHALLSTNTWHDIQQVIKDSLVAAALGRYWDERPDGKAWVSTGGREVSDRQRKKLAGKAIGVRAALVQVRGDWKFFKEVFHFPGWRELRGCCWICGCTPGQVRSEGGMGSGVSCGESPRQEARALRGKRDSY